ncbi:hypothetical protein [Flaviaesturariibacter amylovorans]|uniref:hypothetical protein n=1 Tax=Flaviaesturariibacter amylovorans TaxID=1084520 RepID=UPI0031E5D621
MLPILSKNFDKKTLLPGYRFADDPVSNRRPHYFRASHPVFSKSFFRFAAPRFSKRSAKVRASFILAKFIFEIPEVSFKTIRRFKPFKPVYFEERFAFFRSGVQR